MERQREREAGNKKIEAAVKATMPVISPDPSLTDLAKEERQQRAGLKGSVLLKGAEEKRPGALKRWWTEAVTGHKDPQDATVWGTTKAAILLIALGAFGTGAVLSKRYFDERDENRNRIKAAEKAARRMALADRPPAIVGQIDPKVKKRLDAHITKGRLKIVPKQPEAGALEEQIVDPTDSLSRNISAV
jgi:hypothetical protein